MTLVWDRKILLFGFLGSVHSIVKNTFPDDTILYDNNTEGSIMSRPGTRDFGVYNDYSQRITFQPETSMDAKRFSCNIEHEGYDATAGEDVKSTWFEIKVVGNINLSIHL